jgi:copper chaperone CopZ
MTTIGLHVHDLEGEDGAATVREALARLPAVSSVEVRLTHKRVFVTFDESGTSLEDLRAAVASAGFEVG